MIRSSVLLLSGLLLTGLVGMPNPAIAETASEEIDKRAKNPDWWPAPGRDNKLTRHSDLKDINTDNVEQAADTSGRNRPARCAATKASRSSSSTTASR